MTNKPTLKDNSLALLYKIIAISADRLPKAGKFFDTLILKLSGESPIAQGMITRNVNKLRQAFGYSRF